MITPLTKSVRDSLSWLKFTDEELVTIDYIYATSLMVKNYGGNEDIVAGIYGCWRDASQTNIAVGSDWVDFIAAKIFSLEELRFLVSDKSPYYGIAVRGNKAPSERFCYLMDDVVAGVWSSMAARELWKETLERHEGDTLAAEVSLEFLRLNFVNER